MLKIKVITEENGWEEIPHKRPQNYMRDWSFDRLLKYAKEELYWMDIELDDVIGFEFTDGWGLTTVMKENIG